MFETLEDKSDKSGKPLDRSLPILMYGITAIGSFIFVILGVREHGLSHPFNLALWAAMFLLSVAWLVTSLRSPVPVTHREFALRGTILIWLLIAHRLPYVLR